MKFCQLGQHEVSALWRAKGKTQLSGCKDCVNREKSKQPPSYVSDSTNKKPVKVYSTSTSKISPISDKQAKRLAEYRKVRDKYLKENPFCIVCGTTHNIQLHHMAGRIGDLLTDTRYFATLCDLHHRKVELSPEWAKNQGLSVTRLDK